MGGGIYDVADGDALVDDGHIVYTAVRRCREPRARAPNEGAAPPPIRQKSEPRAILPNVPEYAMFAEAIA
jgi:hypothetical protein